MKTRTVFPWFLRCRLAWLERFAMQNGYIGRNEIVEAFSISSAQASSDLQTYLSLNPNALVYHTSHKRYEWTAKAVLLVVPAPWDAFPSETPPAP